MGKRFLRLCVFSHLAYSQFVFALLLHGWNVTNRWSRKKSGTHGSALSEGGVRLVFCFWDHFICCPLFGIHSTLTRLLLLALVKGQKNDPLWPRGSKRIANPLRESNSRQKPSTHSIAKAFIRSQTQDVSLAIFCPNRYVFEFLQINGVDIRQ